MLFHVFRKLKKKKWICRAGTQTYNQEVPEDIINRAWGMLGALLSPIGNTKIKNQQGIERCFPLISPSDVHKMEGFFRIRFWGKASSQLFQHNQLMAGFLWFSVMHSRWDLSFFQAKKKKENPTPNGEVVGLMISIFLWAPFLSRRNDIICWMEKEPLGGDQWHSRAVRGLWPVILRVWGILDILSFGKTKTDPPNKL